MGNFLYGLRQHLLGRVYFAEVTLRSDEVHVKGLEPFEIDYVLDLCPKYSHVRCLSDIVSFRTVRYTLSGGEVAWHMKTKC